MKKFPKTPKNIERLFVEKISHTGLSSDDDYDDFILCGYDKGKNIYLYFIWNGVSKSFNRVIPINSSDEML